MKKLKGIISFILSISVIFLMMPFNHIYAEPTYGTPFIGVNINVINYDMEKIPYQGQISLETEQTRWACYASSSNGCIAWRSVDTSDVELNEISGRITYNATSTADAYLYEYDFVLDKSYVGSVTFATGTDLGATTSRVFYINGSHLKLTSTSIIRTFTVDSYDLEYAPQETIDMMHSFDFPIESYQFIYMLKEYKWEGIKEYNYYNYPIVNFPTNSIIRSKWGTSSDTYQQIMILGVNKNLFNQSTLERSFTLSNITVDGVDELFRNDYNNVFSFFKVRFHVGSDGNYATFTAKEDMLIIPIYFNYQNVKYISTDFALQYGLSNQLLDDLHIIANGTNQSNSAASGLEQSNNQMSQDMNSLATIESGYNQQFNNSLQTIDFTNPVSSNQGMLPAANFVISIFNGLISNNPFSVLIIVVCILLIGKKVIGK